MKIIHEPEDAQELLDVLKNQDVILDFRIVQWEYELRGDGYSADSLSFTDITDMISNVLGEHGIAIKFKT